MKPNDIPLHLLTGARPPLTDAQKTPPADQNEGKASHAGRGNAWVATPPENRPTAPLSLAATGPARRVPKAASDLPTSPGFSGHSRFATGTASARPLTAASVDEVATLTQRIALFTRRGLESHEAEALADKCMQRDRDMLAPGPGCAGMAACLECDHVGRAGHGRYRCGNWRELDMTRGEALLHGRFVVEFHRCAGFKAALPPECTA